MSLWRYKVMSYYDTVSTKKLKKAERVVVNKAVFSKRRPCMSAVLLYHRHIQIIRNGIQLFALKHQICSAQLFTRCLPTSTPQANFICHKTFWILQNFHWHYLMVFWLEWKCSFKYKVTSEQKQILGKAKGIEMKHDTGYKLVIEFQFC